VSADARIWHDPAAKEWRGNHDFPDSDVSGTLTEVIARLDEINGSPMYWSMDAREEWGAFARLEGWVYPR